MTFRCIHCLEFLDSEHFRVDLRKGNLVRDPRCNECRKAVYICRNFAITREEYRRLMDAACNQCQICGSQETTGRGGRLTIDHDHSTGKLRGVLCHSCNCAIHQFMTPDKLANLAGYLEISNKNNDLPMTSADRKRIANFAEMKAAKGRIAARR